MPTFKLIPDGMIEAFKPVTGRLLTRYSTNLKSVAVFNAIRPGTVQGSTTSATYVTVATLRLWTPLAGPVRGLFQIQVSKDPADGPASARLRESATGAIGTPEISLSANTDDNGVGDNITLDFTSVANTVRLIELQGKGTLSVGLSVSMVLQPTLGGDYLIAAPLDP